MNAITQEKFKYYFHLLEDCIKKANFANYPERIYNIDESGIPLHPKPTRVVSVKGQKRV